MARKTVARKSASSKSKSAKRTTSATKKTTKKTTKKPSPKGRKSTPRSTSSKAKTTNTPAKTKSHKAGDEEVTIDRRSQADRRAGESSESPAPLERREKVQRRRQIDPTTCERDYSVPEVDFMNAMDEYKRKNGRMFPTCSEVLEVIRDLGYVKLTPTELAARRGSEEQASLADASQEVVTNDDTDDDADDALEAFVASETEQF